MLTGFLWIAGGPGIGMQSKDVDFMKRKKVTLQYLLASDYSNLRLRLLWPLKGQEY